jgi:hypothetical protein
MTIFIPKVQTQRHKKKEISNNKSQKNHNNRNSKFDTAELVAGQTIGVWSYLRFGYWNLKFIWPNFKIRWCLYFVISGLSGYSALVAKLLLFIEHMKDYIHRPLRTEKVRPLDSNGIADLNHCLCRHPGDTG